MRIDNGAHIMRGTIAWTRLSIYVGSSILLLTEIYRLSLILLKLVVIAPPLMAFLQNIVQWGLLLGFSCFTFGLYRTLRTHPPVIDFAEYSAYDLNFWFRISLLLSILLVILILLPPTTLVTSSALIFFSSLVSASWLIFYSLLVTWIISYWKLILKEKKFHTLLFSKRIAIHLFLGIFIACYWFLELASLLIFQDTISSIDSVNLTYIVVLLLFLFNQILLFFRVTKFSYSIYG